MLIKCIVIDDEPLAVKGMKEYIADVGFLELAGTYDTAPKAAGVLKKGDVQLLFLDIQMPKITGLEFFKTLQQPPPVIFTTAYPQYALEGFEVNALDYLVKPVSFERFFKAAMKAHEYYEVREKNHPEGVVPATDYFFIKTDNKLVKLFLEDVLFAEALQNYVLIHTKDKKYITYLTFKAVEEYLPEDRFVRTHKSFIVAASQIDSIEANNIRIGTHEIPISRMLKEEVMQKLLNNRFLKR